MSADGPAAPSSYLDTVYDELLAEKDALVVIAKGLGLHVVLRSIVAHHHRPEELVFVINTSHEEERTLLLGLAKAGVNPPPAVLNNECTSQERVELYLAGGVILVTARIFIVDLLCDRVPVEQATGLVVANAHRVSESTNMAFISRIFRQRNKAAFVKALSDDAHGFTRGFAKVEKVMRLLHCKRLQLWPRFHIGVSSVLDGCQPIVDELTVPLSARSTRLQHALLEAVDECLKELRGNNSSIDVSQLSVENALFKSFDTIVRHQLEPVWHRVSKRTRALVTDLQTLRKLLNLLVSYDCVSYYEYLETIFEAAGALHPSERPHWILNASEAVKSLARDRDLVEEINAKRREGVTGGALIVVRDERTGALLKELMAHGAKSLLEATFIRWVGRRRRAQPVTSTVLSSRQHEARLLKAAADKIASKHAQQIAPPRALPSIDLPLTADLDDESGGADARLDFIGGVGDGASMAEHFGLLEEPEEATLICTHAAVASEVLEELAPRYIVLYDPDPAFIRAIELAQALRPARRLHVYFLMQQESVEEQRYRSALRIEREAFESLILEKGRMVITDGWDEPPPVPRLPGETGSSAGATGGDGTCGNNAASRRGGGRATADKPTPVVIVDVREFRSALPNMLHLHGMSVKPVTLEVGDYILSPDICVERKAIPDLIQSLGHGRLYNQAEAMSRYYKKPMLLIECEEGKPFGLISPNELGSEISPQSVLSKISLLVLHFPKLRILWSRCPAHTVAIFARFKEGLAEPDAQTAAAVGAPHAPGADQTFNMAPQDFLRSLPGVHAHNYRKLMNSVYNLKELVEKTQEELTAIIGKENARLVHEFLHRES